MINVTVFVAALVLYLTLVTGVVIGMVLIGMFGDEPMFRRKKSPLEAGDWFAAFMLVYFAIHQIKTHLMGGAV